jgi:hypothetical protein
MGKIKINGRVFLELPQGKTTGFCEQTVNGAADPENSRMVKLNECACCPWINPDRSCHMFMQDKDGNLVYKPHNPEY